MEKMKLPTGEKRDLKKEILDLEFKGDEYRDRGKYYDFLLGKSEEAKALINKELLGGNYSSEKDQEFKKKREGTTHKFITGQEVNLQLEWGQYGKGLGYGIEIAKKDIAKAKTAEEKEEIIYEIIASLKKLESDCEYSSDLLEKGKSLPSKNLMVEASSYFVSQTLSQNLFGLNQFLLFVKELIEKKKRLKKG